MPERVVLDTNVLISYAIRRQGVVGQAVGRRALYPEMAVISVRCPDCAGDFVIMARQVRPPLSEPGYCQGLARPSS